MDTKKKSKAASGGVIAKIAERLKADKRLEFVVYAGIALLIIALYISTLLPKEPAAQTNTSSAQDGETLRSEKELEDRLQTVLSSIRGAGRVEVMITYETGPELVTAMSKDTNSNKSQSVDEGKQSSTEQQTESQKPATVSGSGGTEPIVLTEKQPAVRGVIVVAEGAANIAVRMDLQLAVQTVLNVPLSSIEVFELGSSQTEP
jgi:stage III sporulation protein AG